MARPPLAALVAVPDCDYHSASARDYDRILSRANDCLYHRGQGELDGKDEEDGWTETKITLDFSLIEGDY